MSVSEVSSLKQDYVAGPSKTDSTAIAADKIEVFAGTQSTNDTQNLPQGYYIERTTKGKTNADKKSEQAQAEIIKLEEKIENDKRQLKALIEKQKVGIKGTFNRTPKQENTLCCIGGTAILLGTIGTWILDAKKDLGGMLGLFTGFGLLGGMAAAVIPVGITALLMRSANKKQAESELQQSVTQLQTRISEEQEQLKLLKESV